jgi:two-component system alkaline phosphatase synthesis response regulator PhoP
LNELAFEPIVPSRTPKVLLVEDEPSLARTLGDLLRSQGYEVDIRSDGAEGLEAGTDEAFDLILLDLMLPSMNGFDVCRNLRGRGVDTPVLMLTARSDVGDKVVGFKSGADDYVTKPFETAELQARMEALLRRSAKNVTDEWSYEFGDVKVDFRKGRIVRDNRVVDLFDQECRLLRYFVEHRRQVLSRDTLLTEVWNYKAVPMTRTVDVHIVWLRQKVEADPKNPQFIKTVHGKGYRFDG